MKTKESAAIERVKKLYPGSGVGLVRRYRTVHSEIFILGVAGKESDASGKVFVKYVKSGEFGEVSRQLSNQSDFYDRCTDESVGAPRPLFADPGEGVIITEYIEGDNLKQVLLRTRPPGYDWNRVVEISAEALRRYHDLFAVAGDRPLVPESPLLERKIANAAVERRLEGCSLLGRAAQFVDFGAWNIIYSPGKDKVFLVDFPGVKCVFTPHLDLARFRFSLKIIRQYPQFRFARVNWWDLESVYRLFLKKYGDKSGEKPNESDHAIIDWLEAEYGRKLKDIYRRSGSNVRLLAERLYMRGFLNRLEAA